MRFNHSLYLVISSSACKGRDIAEVAEQAIRGGVDIIQLREKQLDLASFLLCAEKLVTVTARYRVPLIINDNAIVAAKINAEGIHVGNNDVPPAQLRADPMFFNKMIGYSVEHIDHVQNEQAIAADYLGVSPVFKTSTKQDTITEWGLSGIRKIRSLTGKPLVAIGNINVSNAYSVMMAGADCLAVVSAICGASDPEKAARELKNEIKKARSIQYEKI
ncbi:MAG: thiamine phosphate synthase [Chitinophagaceae bacterium]|nr:MAG: thiamine phosphate synthase [Chitinophagaceae bacterium]